MEEERLAMERKAAADREAAERASAEAARRQQQLEAERRAAAEQQTLAAEASRRAAEQERLAAQRAKGEADAARLAAEKASADALAQQQILAQQAAAAKQAAEVSERGRLSAEAEKQALRDQIRQQLNTILETRESARGLIVNLSDVLFDFGKYTLRPVTREKLAKVSGIILAHPGLRIEVEGHTDSVGSEEFNQKLSEQRAGAVRDYLTGQGVRQDMISARGFGKTQPVASNDSAEGRQQNRRVELVVSGEVIGTKTTTSSSVTR
jgi:outer membrane protein OmpA-like peptidoglycan-associated protein